MLRGDITTTLRQAVLEELAAVGYGRLSIEAVARRAGVGKTAIYRRWASKLDMVLEIVTDVAGPAARRCRTPAACEVTSTCPHRHGDQALRHPLAVTDHPDLLAEAARNPQIAAHPAAGVGRDRAHGSATSLSSGRSPAASCPPGTDADIAVDLIIGPLYWRLAVLRRPCGPPEIASLAAAAAAAHPCHRGPGRVAQPDEYRCVTSRRYPPDISAATGTSTATVLRMGHADPLPVIPPVRAVVAEREIEAAVRVMRSGRIGPGPEVEAFEFEFGELVDGRHCVAVNSGTSALQLTLMALGVGAGDEVVIPSFCAPATAHAVSLAGATPVFADIDAATFCVDPRSVEAAIGPRTVALLPVHLYGHPAAMTPLRVLAQRHGLALIEDAAQAHAATWAGQSVGTFGTAGCFSFSPTKNTHCLGGGMVTTADPDLARLLRALRGHGGDPATAPAVVGANLCLGDVAAAVGRVQLAGLMGRTEQRQLNAKFLDSRLTGVVTPPVADPARHVYHRYTIRVADRDAMRRQLLAGGVDTAVCHPTPIHRLAPYARGAGPDLPETDLACAQTLSLPIYPGLTTTELEIIAEAVNAA